MGIQALLSDPLSYLKDILYILPAILPALVLHECAHGWVAFRLGDPTAKMMGRLTLNPLKHLDPVGTLCMVFLGLGWARPVPVNPRYFRNLRRDDLLVSLAGITANLIMFFIGCLLVLFFLIAGLRAIPEDMLYGSGEYLAEVEGALYRVGFADVAAYPLSMKDYLIAPYLGGVWGVVYEIAVNFTLVNLALAIFNLIPIPPLDGYHVLNDIILKRPLFASPQVARIGQGAMLLLLWTGYLGKALSAVENWVIGGVGAGFAGVFRAAGLM
ncbi:MAG: site-2 protease family protein [Clostridia bacterium]|nr:site-2 protease family protein [Clostridia bacterium]MBO4886356.1 site-2 protease family protein [Clostridia bacterium]